MPNYLNTARAAYQVGQRIDVTGQQLESAAINAGWAAAGALASGQNPFTAGVNAAIGSVPGGATLANAANQLTGGALGALGIGGLAGSKPKALHTEYAAGTSNNPAPYRTQNSDVVFYLMRADGGGSSASGAGAGAGTGVLPNPTGGAPPSLTGYPTSAGLGGVEPARVPANVQAGPGFPDGMQSPLNQIAAAGRIATSVQGVSATTRGLVGPLSGLDPNLVVSPGGTSQALATLTPTQLAVFNVTGAGKPFSKRPERSLPGSENYFTRTLHNSFNPTEGFESLGSVESIASALSRPKAADLGAQLAVVSRGIASTVDLIESINYARAGFTTSGGAAQMSRIGPQGLSQRIEE